MSKNKAIAEKFAAECKALGWEFEASNGLVSISKSIAPNDNDEFVKADMEYGILLGMIPTSGPGSMWGTDGGGIGALSAMKSGRFKMKKSGCNKLVCKAIAKLQESH